MPDEPLVTPDDEPLYDDNGEGDPLPIYPIYPPTPPPPGFPPPVDTGDFYSCIATFALELYEAVTEEEIKQGLSAQYLETASLELPLLEAVQTDGDFVFEVQKDPRFPDDRHYTVFVAGTRADAFVILAVNLPPVSTTSKSQIGGSLGKFSLLTQ